MYCPHTSCPCFIIDLPFYFACPWPQKLDKKRLKRPSLEKQKDSNDKIMQIDMIKMSNKTVTNSDRRAAVRFFRDFFAINSIK